MSDHLRALLAGGASEPVGSWSLDLTSGRWTWSPEVYAFLGFAPGQVVPSSDLLLAHRVDVPAAGEPEPDPLENGQPFARHLRVRDAANRERSLLAVGRAVPDEDGTPTSLHGYLMDLTRWRRSFSESDIRDGIEAATEFRGAIDQAKGALMAIYGLTADEAFVALVRQSQDANVKVRDLAARLVEALDDAPDLVASDGQDPQTLLRLVARGETGPGERRFA